MGTRSGFGRVDDAIQKRVQKIRQTQGDEAADKFEAQQYREAAAGLGKLAGAAAAGAAVGSIVPVVGTTVGFVAGLWGEAARQAITYNPHGNDQNDD